MTPEAHNDSPINTSISGSASQDQQSPTILENLQQILEELQQLTEPSEMAQAGRLCQTALKLVSQDSQPELWAWLQFQLGSSLVQNPLGDQNLERSTGHLKQALKVYTRRDFPEQWAAIQNNLAAAYQKRIKGVRDQNLERSIGHLKQALKVYTRRDFPEQWAETQNHLALVYWDRIGEDRAQNLEETIRHYKQALKVYTRRNLPERWAMIQNDLANVYLYRIRGDKAQNLERAIGRLKQALKVYTRRDFPEQWAAVQNNLANAYSDRIREDRAQNLERAIEHYERALVVRTRQDFPEKWAMTQNNLANAYSRRIREDRAQNLERAIQHSKQALEIYTRQNFPYDWAMAQANLANAYSERIRGDRAENLERATGHLKQALKVYTRQNFPEQWAMIQNNLAASYSERIKGRRAQNLERAIRHLKQGLEVYTPENFPQDWAMTQNNLANAYSDRLQGRKAQNLEEAIRHYEQALKVYTRQNFPQDWAAIQNNLAAAYWDRIKGNRAQNLEQAIEHYEQALLIRTRQDFPQDCRNTAYALGNLLYEERHFTEARKAFTTAHEAVEALRGDLQREEATRELAEENALLYAHLVHCCLHEDDEEAAFEYAAAGKGRAFVDLLATVRFDPSGAGAEDPQLAEGLRKARELRQQIGNLMAQLTGRSTLSTALTSQVDQPFAEMRAKLRALQDEHDRLWEDMSYNYPALTATQRVPTLPADEARKLSAELGATLVEYYEHANGWCAFVVTPEEVRYIPLPEVNDDLLERMINWLRQIESVVGRGKLSYRPLRHLHEAVFAPLRDYLPAGEAIFLAPFSRLHLLPLGTALDANTKRYAAEDYRLAFTPSLAALRVVVEQVRRRGALAEQPRDTSLLIAAYPGSIDSEYYLPNVLPEAEAVGRYFDQVTPLYEEAATPEAVLVQASGKDMIHMGCHGWFDLEAPDQSGLMLARGWLTVQRIITELRLDQTRLATLSACLSGRVGVRHGEEHVGLLQAMMSAGSRAVITSLWSVNDAATRALFEAFYSDIQADTPLASALARAARAVRSRQGWEHPYYWAAFQANGLAHGPGQPKPEQLATEVRERIEEAYQESVESMRGGLAMDTEKMVRDGMILLEQMTENPEEVVGALNPAERERTLERFGTLEKQAAGVQNEAELLALADAVNRFVEETPALANLLLPEGVDMSEAQKERRITLENYRASSPESQYVQQYAPQIRNRIIECHQELERKLQELFLEEQGRQ